MTTLYSPDAVLLVRKNLDEVGPNDSVMYTDENGDNASLDDIIYKHLPEAINAVHMAAPVQLLEGEEFSFSNLSTGESITKDASSLTLSFTILASRNYLRLVAFQTVDSAIVVTDVIPEASPEGRKQLKSYLRGRPDRPRLVRLQGKSDPSFIYYTISSSTSGAAASIPKQFSFVKEQFYIAPTTTTNNGVTTTTYPSYNISRLLRQNIIDYLTGMVMTTYGDQRAQAYFQKATIYPNI